MELALTIESHKSCNADDQLYSEVFEAVGQLTNRSKQTLTVFLGVEYPRRMRVAHSLEDMVAGRFEAVNYAHVLPANKSGEYMLGSDPSKQKKVVLKPGQSVSIRDDFALVIYKVDPPSFSGTVGAGDHYVQVETNFKLTGPAPTEGTVKQTGKPAKFHWVTVRSEPVRVTVPTTPTLQKCD